MNYIICALLLLQYSQKDHPDGAGYTRMQGVHKTSVSYNYVPNSALSASSWATSLKFLVGSLYMNCEGRTSELLALAQEVITVDT